MNEILNTAITALVLLVGLAALVRYTANDVFSGPFRSPRSGEDVLDPRRRTSARLDLPGLSRP